MSTRQYVTQDAEDLAALYGDYWGEHPRYPSTDWIYEVSEGNTRQGYWDWVVAQIELGDSQ